MSLILPKDCRIEVLNFAVGMETKLRENEHKGGWKTTPNKFLTEKLLEEVAELLHSTTLQAYTDHQLIAIFEAQLARIRKGYSEPTSPSTESYDVGNIAMMFSDPERTKWEYGKWNAGEAETLQRAKRLGGGVPI